MPRTPSIHYYDSRKAYYTKFNGKQHLLAAGPKDGPDGPTFQKATTEFARVMHAEELQRTADGARLSAVVTWYYHHLQREGRISSLKLTKTVLDPAVFKLGSIKVRELKPFAVTDWLDSMKTWNSSTKHTALSQLNSALFWAKDQGLLSKNPLEGMKGKPEKLSRGKETVIPEPLQELLIAEAKPTFSFFLRLARGTGARPGELLHANCGHYRSDLRAIVFPWNPPAGEYRWKCGKKTKRDRIIYLTPDLQEMVELHVSQRDRKEPIAPTERNKRWSHNNLRGRQARTLDRPEVQEWIEANAFDASRLNMYSWRHSYITRMLLKGCPIKLLADLCGTSVQMIERNYAHTHDNTLAMRNLFLQFS